MKIEFVEIDELSGPKCKVYSIILNDGECTVFDEFITQYQSGYENEVIELYNTIKTIGNLTGPRDGFFKEYEGKPGDGVCALFDEEKKLRLYCIKFGKIAVILGGGGEKPDDIRRWQDDEILTENAELMIRISQIMTQAQKDKDLKITANGELIGEMEYEVDE